MYISRRGEGVPLLLIHGFCEDTSVWEYLLPKASKYCEVITIDLPGFGQSGHIDIPVTISAVAAKIHQFLSATGIKDYLVAGHSLGGYVALEIARQFPSALSGLVLINSTAFADDIEKNKLRLKTIKFVENRGVEAFIRSFTPQLFADRANPGIRKTIAIGVKTTAGALLAYSHMMMSRRGNTETLRSWHKPCLFIAGSMDTLVNVASSRKHLDFLSDQQYFELDRSGHMSMLESAMDIDALLHQLVRTISE